MRHSRYLATSTSVAGYEFGTRREIRRRIGAYFAPSYNTTLFLRILQMTSTVYKALLTWNDKNAKLYRWYRFSLPIGIRVIFCFSFLLINAPLFPPLYT